MSRVANRPIIARPVVKPVPAIAQIKSENSFERKRLNNKYNLNISI